MDDTFGVGFTDRVQAVLTAMDPNVPADKQVLDLFVADRFIVSSNENYQAIENVARKLGIIR